MNTEFTPRIELKTFRIIKVPIDKLTPMATNPPSRMTDKKLVPLRKRIEQHRIIVPIIVYEDTKKNTLTIVDGNRRYLVAKEIGITSLPCMILNNRETRLKIEDLFVILNTTLNIIGNQKIYLARNANVFFNENYKKKYDHLIRIGGTDIIDFMIERKKGLENYYSYMKKGANYIKFITLDDMKTLIFWIVKHGESKRLREAIEQGISPSLIRQAIKMDISLKGFVFK